MGLLQGPWLMMVWCFWWDHIGKWYYIVGRNTRIPDVGSIPGAHGLDCGDFRVTAHDCQCSCHRCMRVVLGSLDT